MSRAALYDIVRVFEARMEAISQEYIRVMGRHLRELGAIGPADLNRLAQLERAGKNAEELRRRIAKEARMSLKDLDALLAAAARENAAYAARMSGGGTGINLAKNPRLLRILRAQAAITRQSMLNLSQTTVETGRYRNAISVAVQAVQTGAADYASAIRRALRDAAGVELRYPSGVTRRLDTAVRQNVLDGVRSLNQAMMQEIGSQLGADGVEISAHMLCAEDHLPYQGRQYSLKAFEAIQGSLARPFGMWNCKHTMHPIFLGISEPAYSEEDLKKYEAFSTEPVEIGGRTLTRYEWSQRQRAIETAVRKEKDAAIAFEASGDRRGQREAQARIQALTQHYNHITGEAGLEPEYGRMYVRGYRRINGKALTGVASDGTIAIKRGVPADWQNVLARSVTTIQHGFSAYSKTDLLYAYTKKTKPEKGFYDVAMHGSPTLVAFGAQNEGFITARELANFIRHREDYHGEPIRLLSCSTGVDPGNGEYCFAEHLANALGVVVKAPDDLIYFTEDGDFYIGIPGNLDLKVFKPNQRRRIK